ncbi:sialidase precursor, exo-alpha-sialidase [Arcticibacter svalbardensis MN12-7]|uniref:Sialidase, exo-alpha-sialidase n=1 Tax=Arcticibacter svalbardensis MN12-7 TaxID=1150600 RepID=R9GR46_9SPHI|nr:DUF1735 domain-containing protein [Arcticibacter svalbardensis]EOR94317.1 sialidase precursor, exo-alpha-sialidase [Arcticibacter svalbardensis MN12-7]
MKDTVNYKILGLLICISFALGCGKADIDMLQGNQDVYSSVYMPQAVNSPAVHQFSFSNTPDTIFYGANYGGPGILSADIQVNFEEDAALVAKFNETNFTNYKAMPAGSFAFEKNTVVLSKAKQSTDPLRISIFTDKLDGVGGYLLPVTIKTDGLIKVNESLKTTYYLINATYATNPYVSFDNSTWEIVSLSSEETTGEGVANGRAIYAFDKNGATFWTTQWKTAKPGPPHIIAVDMKEEKKLRGFIITGRKETTGLVKATGNPRDIIIQTSMDGITWTYSQSFALANVLENTIYLNYAQMARFFKITINASQGDTYLTHIAELSAF